MTLLSFGAGAYASPSLRQGAFREKEAAIAEEEGAELGERLLTDSDVTCDSADQGQPHNFAIDIMLTPQGGHDLKDCTIEREKALQDAINEFLFDYGMGGRAKGGDSAFLAEVCETTSSSDPPAPELTSTETTPTSTEATSSSDPPVPDPPAQELTSTETTPTSTETTSSSDPPAPELTSIGTSNGIPFPCCGWEGGGCSEPDDAYCQGNEAQCTGDCSGQWYTDDQAPELTSTEATPTSTETTPSSDPPAPDLTSTQAPPTSTETTSSSDPPAPELTSTQAPPSSTETTSSSDPPAPELTSTETTPTSTGATPTSIGTSNGIPFPCCGWEDGGCSEPDDAYCQGNEAQCTGDCSGQWYTDDRAPELTSTETTPTSTETASSSDPPAPELTSTETTPSSAETTPSSDPPAPELTSIGTSNGIPFPCCGWEGGGCSEPDDAYCQGNEAQCTGDCSGKWYTDDRRQLAAKNFRYYGGGFCRFCLWDNLDARRLWSEDPDWFINSFKPELQNLVRNDFTASVAPDHWACLGFGPRVDVNVWETEETPNTDCAH